MAVTLTANVLSQTGGSKWPIGDSGPSCPRVADEDVELLPAPEDRRAEPVECVEVRHVAGNERCLSARGSDLIVQRLERALRAGKRDHVRAASCELPRDGVTNAP